MTKRCLSFCLFFFNDTATTEIYTLSLHDALPICCFDGRRGRCRISSRRVPCDRPGATLTRSEEHTSELQSRLHLVCRLLLEKKKRMRHQNRSHESSRNQTSTSTASLDRVSIEFTG